jgi:hypothetical protein
MTAPIQRPRRRSGKGGSSHTLARLTAAREQLDANIAERRRREDALLAQYAAVADAVADVAARRDAALADLDRQAEQLRDDVQQELAALQTQQGDILVALHANRPAEQLADLVGLPLKRVRVRLRAHRGPAPTAASDTADGTSPDAPAPAAPALAAPPPDRPGRADSRPTSPTPPDSAAGNGAVTAAGPGNPTASRSAGVAEQPAAADAPRLPEPEPGADRSQDVRGPAGAAPADADRGTTSGP